VTIRLGKGIGVEVFESQEPGLDYRNLAIEFVRERDVAWTRDAVDGGDPYVTSAFAGIYSDHSCGIGS
jgi:hypothetical protein